MEMTEKLEEYRDQAVQYVRSQLFGPAGGEEEVVTGKPFARYLCGILFPVETEVRELGESDEPDVKNPDEDLEIDDSSLGKAYTSLPSSMGVSFFVGKHEHLICWVEGATYGPVKGEKDVWIREPIGTENDPASVKLVPPAIGVPARVKVSVFEERASVVAIYRPKEGGHLVTVTLVNEQLAQKNKSNAKKIAAMLFQCKFRVDVVGGEIGDYPTVIRFSRHDEDEELALAYRHKRTFGIGHGCAATWEDGEGPLKTIHADPLPAVKVRGLTNEIDLPEEATSVLSIQWLASPDRNKDELMAALNAFVDCYSEWVIGQQATIESLGRENLAPAKRIVAHQEMALERMRRGIEILGCEDEKVGVAFRLAQEAMLRQFLWSKRCGTPVSLGEGATGNVDPWASEHASTPSWRPFQLAFQLLVLESLANPASDDRDNLDLLWFPTGGGKTEAYLALSAFEIIYRRLRYSGDAGSGTCVMMRYTLRLLTSQQFERCAILVSVLERMRIDRPELELGDRKISLGLWVGGETTPNALDRPNDDDPGAFQLFEDRILVDERPQNPFQLVACPCCGTRIVPERKSHGDHYGVNVTPQSFKMFCPDKNCDLHDDIPVSMVDEDLYRHPPTFLIGTIDKFARMVWDPNSRVFLGQGTDCLPPTLVIQDELHLITGPLGTIAGTYEAAIDTTLKLGGVNPKYIAATATIQRASEQCQALYARDAAVFPPMGLSSDDSFFSQEDGETPGRLFLGAMGNGLYSSLTSLIQVSAACAGSVQAIDEHAEVGRNGTRARDCYWTQVIYHNSRQELGKTTTMLRDDVATKLELSQPDKANRRRFEIVEELSANLKGAEVSEAKERLKIEWPSEDAIDVLACTNMISVGVDISRLGLMIMKGQPKSTSEYIQATSRVGRDGARPPGIVVAMYAAARPRDRSHYEGFQPYHQSLYRSVEPVTVTPFAPPAQDRTLHAAIILACRAVLGWLKPEDAKKFDRSDPQIKQVLDTLLERLLQACRDDEIADVRSMFEDLTLQWTDWAQQTWPAPFVFSSGGARQYTRLLREFSEDGEGFWKTLNSMRHVDGEAPFQVRGE
jgi:hypothetical protein